MEYRFRQHIHDAKSGSTFAVHSALRKYSVSHEVLYTSNDLSFIRDIMEPYFIKLFESHTSKNGYNMTDGGDGCVGLSESSRRKISIAKIGKIQSEESNRKRRDALKGVKKSQSHRDKHAGQNNHFWGKNHSIETKILIGNGNRGRIESPEICETRRKAALKMWADRKMRVSI